MIVVTGGAGFIGSNLVNALSSKQAKTPIVIIDRLGIGDKWQNIKRANISNIISPENAMSFLNAYKDVIQVVFHLGSLTDTTSNDAESFLEDNFRSSLDIFYWCCRNQKRFIYASSAATYGDGSKGFLDKEDLDYLSSLNPLNAYAWSKNLFDKKVFERKASGKTMPPQCVGFKIFTAYGPNEYHKEHQRSVVNQIFWHAFNSAHVELFKSYKEEYADGEQKRDFIWVGDIVDVMLWFLENPDKSGLYNLGSGQARTFKDLANAVFAALESEPNIKFKSMPEEIKKKYQYFTQADLDKLRSIGYDKPFTSIEDGVKKYVQEYLIQEDPYL